MNMADELKHIVGAVTTALVSYVKRRYSLSDLVITCLQPRDRYTYGIFVQSTNLNDNLACCFYFNTGPFDMATHVQDEILDNEHKVIVMLGMSKYSGTQKDICDFLADGPPIENASYMLYEDGSYILYENNVDKILYEV